MLTITDDAVRRAFQAYKAVYGRNRDWGIHEFAPLWGYGRRAFGSDRDRAEFDKLYSALRYGWLVFRSSHKNYIPPSADTVYAILIDAFKGQSELLTIRLGTLGPSHLPAIRSVLHHAAAIKRNNDGPSLVAVSKFLHFGNPGLFVIVDNQVMESFVFQQAWLYDEIAAMNKEIASELTGAPQRLAGVTTHFAYEAIVYWARRLVRHNPNIPKLFAEFARGAAPEEPPGEYEQFEAAAVEMLLLGLANMPPAGVQVGANAAVTGV